MKQLVIYKDDLRHNIERIKEYTKNVSNNDEYTIIGVVKGNGYGLGIIEYAEFLKENGINYFAVATIEEAIKLSKENKFENILLLSPINNREDLEIAIKNNIIVTIDSEENVKNLNEISKQGYDNIRVHIKIDTGFGRYGFLYSDYENILKAINELDKSINIEGIFSHFSVSYYKNNKHTLEQFERFKKVLEILEKNQIDIKLKHICNSSAILNYPEMCLNAARVGSGFLGRVAAENNIGLKKIGCFEVKIEEIRIVPKGFNISYLNTYTTNTEQKIAILPVGYMDGFNLGARPDMYRKRDKIRRALREIKNLFKKNNLTAMINGKKYDVIGTIGMFHAIVKIDDNVKIGDTVYLEVNPMYVDREVRREYR